MFDIILEVFLVYIFQYPGAAIRWFFSSRKKTIKEILKDEPYVNATITLLTISLFVMIIRYSIK
jgi:hypothetical protein